MNTIYETKGKNKQVQCIKCFCDIHRDSIALKEKHRYYIDGRRHFVTTYVCKNCATKGKIGI